MLHRVVSYEIDRVLIVNDGEAVFTELKTVSFNYLENEFRF
jgi:hypothetical protein